MKIIERDNAAIDYNISGDGDTTLVFVHGAYIDQTYWKAQVEYFSKEYKVVTLDLPWHGKSGRERKKWSMDGFAKDVNELITQLSLSNVILIGHSMGGDINLMAVSENPDPVIGFIAIDIFKNAATPLPPEFQERVEQIKQGLKNEFEKTNESYARMALLTKQTPTAITEKIVAAYRNAYQPMAIATTAEIFEMYKTEQNLLPDLKLPLYLISVDYMPVNEAPLKLFAGAGYEVSHMRGTSHYPMLENPELLNRLIEEAIHEIVHNDSY